MGDALDEATVDQTYDDDLATKVMAIVANMLECEDRGVRPEDDLTSDLGADIGALNDLDIVLEVEFSIDIPDEDWVVNMETVADVIDTVRQQVAASTAG